MVCFCFLVDQTRKVRRSKPAAGTCSRCGSGASVADMRTATRFCHVPFYWKSWKAIMCTFCGAILKSYRWVCIKAWWISWWVLLLRLCMKKTSIVLMEAPKLSGYDESWWKSLCILMEAQGWVLSDFILFFLFFFFIFFFMGVFVLIFFYMVLFFGGKQLRVRGCH